MPRATVEGAWPGREAGPAGCGGAAVYLHKIKYQSPFVYVCVLFNQRGVSKIKLFQAS